MKQAPGPPDKMYFYESFAEEFDGAMNMYDARKRVAVVFDELLPEDLTGQSLLDAGCGTGWFSQRAVERGAEVTSMDLGEGLLAQVRKKCRSTCVVGSVLDMPFADATFDVVISSEVIEHVPAPLDAVREMHRVLKPGGLLVLTTPNKRWFFLIWLANKLKLRPYQGLENWVSWRTLKHTVQDLGFEIERMQGIHLFPFVIGFLHPVLDYFHRFSQPLGPVMLNMALRAKKKPAAPS